MKYARLKVAITRSTIMARALSYSWPNPMASPTCETTATNCKGAMKHMIAVTDY